MPKKTIYIIGIIFLIVGILSFIPNFVNWDNCKTKIVQYINNNNKDFTFDVKGKIHLSIIPWPSIMIKNCTMISKSSSTDDLTLNNLNIKADLSLWSLFTGNFSFSKITFINGNISLKLGAPLKTLLSAGNNTNKHLTSIKEIAFQNTNISLLKPNTPIIIFNNITANIITNHKDISIKGKFSPLNIETINLDFKLKYKGNKADITTLLTSPNFILSLKGILNNESENWNITGKSNTSIKDFSIFSNQYLITCLPFLNNVYSTESLTIESDVLISEQEISFKDLNIKSNSIKASGYISDIISHSSVIDINLTFNKLDLDNLIKYPNLNQDSLAEQKALSNLMNTSSTTLKQNSWLIPKNLDILFYVDIQDMIYNNYHLNNTKVNAELSNGIIELYYTTLEFNQDTKIELSGTISSNDIRPIFSGLINAQGTSISPIMNFLGYKNKDIQNNNFVFYTKVTATPKEINLFELDATIDTLSLNGNIILRLHDKLHINSDLNITSLNLDNYGLSHYLSDLVQEIKQSNYNYLSNLQWLRTIKFEANFNLDINNLTINQYVFPHITTNLFLAPSILKFEDLSIQSENIDFNGIFALDIRYLRPKIDINFEGSNYNDNFINQLLFSNPEKPIATTTNNKNISHKWSITPLNLTFIHTFDGNIVLNFDKASINSLNLEKLNFEAKLTNYILYITKLSTYVFGGQFAATGLLSTQPMVFSMSYVLNNASLEQLLDKLFKTKSITGYISTNGNISTQGTSIATMISQLNSDFIIAARQAEFNGVDINVLVNSTNHNNYNIQEFGAMLHSALNGSTTFNTIDGTFNIQNGLMQTKSIELTTDRTRGVFSGNIDLNSWLLNTITEFAFIPKAGAQPLSFTVKVSGNIDKVSKEIQADALKNYLMTTNTTN
ncbi:MAG: AsmA-like C-terminal region-containing protein [Rickettsiales endosymbiont of Dermacentor nuttalli]